MCIWVMLKKFVRYLILWPAAVFFALLSLACWSNAHDHGAAGKETAGDWMACIFCFLAAVLLFMLQRRLAPAPVITPEFTVPARPPVLVSRPPAHSSIVQWARSVLENRDQHVILDTETTGYTATSEIIQIAISDLHGNPVFVSKVRPLGLKRMPGGAKAVHGLGIPDLKDAPTWIEVCQEVCEKLRGKTVLAYNAKYDERLVRQTVERYNTFSPEPSSWTCLMLAYAEFVGERRRDGQFKWQKLPGTEHEAMADCRAALRILEQIASGERPVLPAPKVKQEEASYTIKLAELLVPVAAPSANDTHPLKGQEGQVFTCLYPDSTTGALVAREFKFKRFNVHGDLLVIEVMRDGVPVKPQSKMFKFERVQNLRRVG